MSKGALAGQVAKNVMKYARDINYPDIEGLKCPDCLQFPVRPITGYCGHTRCAECILRNGSCYCGCIPPKFMHLNIFVKQLIEKIQGSESRRHVGSMQSAMAATSSGNSRPPRLRPQAAWHHKKRSRDSSHYSRSRFCFFTNPEDQYEYAQGLVKAGQYRNAAPHLAHVAASNSPVARRARNCLFQSAEELLKRSESSRLTRELYRAVRASSAVAWLDSFDLECVICYKMLYGPVTTPCGHTFCRNCILRTIKLSKQCAICRYPLDTLSIVMTADTSFVSAALLAFVSPPMRYLPECKLVPILKCTVAFPSVSCPIMILGIPHSAMIRRILESGNRRFGMLANSIDDSLTVCGTIIEVRDCVKLEDGQVILSTIGIARFQKISESVEDSCQMARILDLQDIIPTDEEVQNTHLEQLAGEITGKTMMWLSTLPAALLSDIEDAFGPMPLYCDANRWWMNPQSPEWLWWIIAILPLKPEIQLLMLSTCSLHKRMMAVTRSLNSLCSVQKMQMRQTINVV